MENVTYYKRKCTQFFCVFEKENLLLSNGETFRVDKLCV